LLGKMLEFSDKRCRVFTTDLGEEALRLVKYQD